MDYNFKYPHPSGYFCNYKKQNNMNTAIFGRNEQLHCKFENQLSLRFKSHVSCRYNDTRKDIFPSSSNYVAPEQDKNIGYMKCYSQNIDDESKLIHSKRAQGICRPLCDINKCLVECYTVPDNTDCNFPIQYNRIWNNPTKRKHLN